MRTKLQRLHGGFREGSVMCNCCLHKGTFRVFIHSATLALIYLSQVPYRNERGSDKTHRNALEEVKSKCRSWSLATCTIQVYSIAKLHALTNISYFNTFECSQNMLYPLSPLSFKFWFRYVVLDPWDETIKYIGYGWMYFGPLINMGKIKV